MDGLGLEFSCLAFAIVDEAGGVLLDYPILKIHNWLSYCWRACMPHHGFNLPFFDTSYLAQPFYLLPSWLHFFPFFLAPFGSGYGTMSRSLSLW